MKKIIKLSIIIVNFNTKKLLWDCLNSIFKNTKELEYEIIVVDNHSSDASSDLIKKEFPAVKLIENSRNLGFGKANNLGAQKASGEILLFLNSDTLVPQKTLQEMLTLFKQKPEIGIAVPKLLTPENQMQKGAFGLEPNLWNILTRVNENYSLQSPNLNQIVAWVSGAALFIRKDLFEKIKGFDTRYFMYFEDIDLCMRIKKLGFKIFYNARVSIVHLGGKSIKLSKERKTIYYKSLERFYAKHYGKIKLIFLKFFLFFYKLIRYGI